MNIQWNTSKSRASVQQRNSKTCCSGILSSVAPLLLCLDKSWPQMSSTASLEKWQHKTWVMTLKGLSNGSTSLKFSRNAEQGRHFSGYSLVGHSLGGLVARVVPVHMDLKPRHLVRSMEMEKCEKSRNTWWLEGLPEFIWVHLDTFGVYMPLRNDFFLNATTANHERLFFISIFSHWLIEASNQGVFNWIDHDHIGSAWGVFVSLFSPNAGVETFVSATVMPAVLQVTGIDKGAAADVLEKDVEKNILTKLSFGKYADAFMAFDKRVLISRVRKGRVQGSVVSDDDSNDLWKFWERAECSYDSVHVFFLCVFFLFLWDYATNIWHCSWSMPFVWRCCTVHLLIGLWISTVQFSPTQVQTMRSLAKWERWEVPHVSFIYLQDMDMIHDMVPMIPMTYGSFLIFSPSVDCRLPLYHFKMPRTNMWTSERWVANNL